MTDHLQPMPIPIDVVTVLVAGHHTSRLPGSAVSIPLSFAINGVLAAMQAATLQRSASCRVLTGVTEGIDTSVAEISSQLDLPLHLLAPGLPQTLVAAQERAERKVWLGAPDPGAHGDEAYSLRDEIALCFCDVAVVVWDGEAPRGLQGGAVRLAFKAAQMMKPTVWIDTEGSIRLLDRSRLDVANLHRLGDCHASPDWLRQCFSDVLDTEGWRARLADEIAVLLNPVQTLDLAHESDRAISTALSDYQSTHPELPTTTRAGHIHKAWMSIMGFSRHGFVARFEEKRAHANATQSIVAYGWKQFAGYFKAKAVEPYWGPAKPAIGQGIVETPMLETQFHRSDIEANLAAGRHRDSTWLIYGASALAVFSAVAGAIDLWPGKHGPLWSIVELILVAGIIGGVYFAKKQRWHPKWIGHRFLAEQIRYARMCLPLMAVPRLFSEPAWQAVVKNNTGFGALKLCSPELWHVQRLLSKEGLPVANGQALNASALDKVKTLRTYVLGVVQNQADYHRDNHHNCHHVHERLHLLSLILFAATALAVLAHFPLHEKWLLICTAFFPSLAAAIHGISTKLEIARLAGQSAATEERLSGFVEVLKADEQQNDWQGWLRLRRTALDAAAAMSDENGQWQKLVQHQDAELPA